MVEEIKKYDSISEFLNDCGHLLMQKECENNVILGMCNVSLNKLIDLDKFMMVAATEKDGTIISCVLMTPNRTSLATFTTQTDVAIQPLANYFNRNHIDLKGLAGETCAVHSFMKIYPKSIMKSVSILLYKIETLNKINLVQNSILALATMEDLPVLTLWLKNFRIDADLLPLKPDNEIQIAVEDKIKKKVLYKLVFNEGQQPVSMLAIVRETAKFDIISWVYTPPESRNKGYATTAVYKLAELTQNIRKKQCALFADQSNSASNKIYQNIGFQLLADYLEVDF